MAADLHPILSGFDPISLQDMDRVQLMDRTDTKYLFGYNELPAILEQLQSAYTVLDTGHRLRAYKTLYYDTPSFSLYTKHHNGILNRYKVRYRRYAEAEPGFLEVKLRNNRGRTVKARVRKQDAGTLQDDHSVRFLDQALPFDHRELTPVVWIHYNRLTLVHKANAERLTIDTHLEFVNGNHSCDLSPLVIAEVKQERKQASAFTDLMKQRHIAEATISKYCTAIALTQPQVKTNNFKPTLQLLKKIIGHDAFTNRF